MGSRTAQGAPAASGRTLATTAAPPLQAAWSLPTFEADSAVEAVRPFPAGPAWALHATPLSWPRPERGGALAVASRPGSPLQRHLRIGAAHDAQEDEASRVADAVTRGAAPVAASHPTTGTLQRQCACGGTCAHCREERERRLQRAAAGPGAPTEAPPIVDRVLARPGQPLDASTRRTMEAALGHDFSHVQVHVGADAAASADAVDADAYTVGSHVVFGGGQFAPQSAAGRGLLAHELTHVVQQGTAGAAAEAMQRQPRRSPGRRRSSSPPRAAAARAPASRGAPVVDDGARVGPGQMERSVFLTTLRDVLIRDCDAELRPFARTAQGCPYILRTIERYARRPAAQLVRLIQAFAHPPRGADAMGLIAATTRQARGVARRLGEKHGGRPQTMLAGSAAAAPGPDPAGVRSRLGGGTPLQAPTRGRMESAFGRRFDRVRIHADAPAAEASASLGARAFTIGPDVAFAAGEYRPGTAAGDTLIAHELAHTIQQGSGRPRPVSAAADAALEREADHAAAAVNARRDGVAAAGVGEGAGERIQRWPVVVAGAIVVAEAAPEAIVIAEVATVTTEVVVVDSALVVTADIAAPAAIEALAPAAVETLAPAAVETAAVSSSTSTAVAVTAAAATTLSSDSPTSSDEEEGRRRCQETHPTALPCLDEIDRDEVVQEFLYRNGYGFESLGECWPRSSVNAVRECNGAPGVSWHCNVEPYSDPIARVSKPGGEVSIFSCLCCRADGATGAEWRGEHWSPGA